MLLFLVPAKTWWTLCFKFTLIAFVLNTLVSGLFMPPHIHFWSNFVFTFWTSVGLFMFHPVVWFQVALFFYLKVTFIALVSSSVVFTILVISQIRGFVGFIFTYSAVKSLSLLSLNLATVNLGLQNLMRVRSDEVWWGILRLDEVLCGIMRYYDVLWGMMRYCLGEMRVD